MARAPRKRRGGQLSRGCPATAPTSTIVTSVSPHMVFPTWCLHRRGVLVADGGAHCWQLPAARGAAPSGGGPPPPRRAAFCHRELRHVSGARAHTHTGRRAGHLTLLSPRPAAAADGVHWICCG